MNCCNDNGQCTQAHGCPARMSKMPAHDREPNNLPDDWVSGDSWVFEAIHAGVTALIGFALIGSIVYLAWVS